MGGRPFLQIIAAALAAVALSAALGAPPAVASEEPAEGSEPATITTVLHPGWNMVGWVGPETPASDLFDEIPALTSIFAWDSKGGDYRRRARATVHRLDPLMLAPGQGLWLYLDGETSVEWTRAASEDSVLLELPAGRNLVAWAGRDGTPIAEAVERLGERLERVWRWDAGASQYRLYHSPATARTELDHGDALLIEMTEDARWWQSGAGQPVVFLGEFTGDERAEISAWVDGTQRLFAERWGVVAPFTTYVGDREAVAPTYRRIRGSTGVTGCGNYSNSVIFLVDACVNGGAHAHEYFHAVQFHLIGQPGKWVPGWMIEGSAAYALSMYRGAVSGFQTAEEHIAEDRTQDAAVIGYYDLPTLPEIEDYRAMLATPSRLGHHLGFLGAAWLAEHAGEQSIIDFFVRLADEPSWREAFEGAFGITVDDFYEAFAAYRAEAIPLLPHLTDDSAGPVLMFLGDVPEATQRSVRANFDNLRAFFRERFDAGTADYTVLAAVEPAGITAAHRRAFGEEPPERFCDRSAVSGLVFVINLSCHDMAPHELDRAHFNAWRWQVAPFESRPPMPGGFAYGGPVWLDGAAETYAQYAYRTAVGDAGADQIWEREFNRAGHAAGPLGDLDTQGTSWENRDAMALGFLALAWLADQAGEGALFDYYRLLPESASWEDAFEGAFGMEVLDFHQSFEVHRSELALPTHPFPHMTDDRVEPVLAFVGDILADTRQSVREVFTSVRAFFSEELGAAAPDYTLYVAADDDAVSEPYELVHGRPLTEGFCYAAYGAVAIIDASCLPWEGLVNAIAWSHFIAVRDRPEPASRPPRTDGGGLKPGPRWLDVGAPSFASYLYAAAAGRAYYDALLRSELARAQQVASALSTMETRAGLEAYGYFDARALAIVAVKWLAERAGNPSIIDYYRLLPDSETWEEAFEGAFGIAVDEFYEAFEAYRARIAPPNEDEDSS